MTKIRKAKLGDEIGIAQLFKECIEQNFWKYTATNKYNESLLEKLKISLSSQTSNSRYFVALSSENKIIGSASYKFNTEGRMKHRIDMGWGVHPDFAGKGIGTRLVGLVITEAKKEGFVKAEAEIAIENISSWKLALRCGFEIEGVKKKALLTDEGEYIDTFIVGKLL